MLEMETPLLSTSSAPNLLRSTYHYIYMKIYRRHIKKWLYLELYIDNANIKPFSHLVIEIGNYGHKMDKANIPGKVYVHVSTNFVYL